MVGRTSAFYTYRMDFLYVFCNGHECRHRTERLAHEVGVKTGNDHSDSSVGESLDDIDEGVVEELRNADFASIEPECQYNAKKGWLSKEGAISKISVSGQTQFDKGEWFAEEAILRITYYSYETTEEMILEST